MRNSADKQRIAELERENAELRSELEALRKQRTKRPPADRTVTK